MDKILSKYESDAETGLHYAEACYYDSRLSTFNSTDPMWTSILMYRDMSIVQIIRHVYAKT